MFEEEQRYCTTLNLDLKDMALDIYDIFGVTDEVAEQNEIYKDNETEANSHAQRETTTTTSDSFAESDGKEIANPMAQQHINATNSPWQLARLCGDPAPALPLLPLAHITWNPLFTHIPDGLDDNKDTFTAMVALN